MKLRVDKEIEAVRASSHSHFRSIKNGRHDCKSRQMRSFFRSNMMDRADHLALIVAMVRIACMTYRDRAEVITDY